MARKLGKKPSKRRLKSLEDTRRFVSAIINALNRDDLELNKAKGLGYLCQILAKVIEGDSIESRVAALEEALKNRETQQ